MRDWYFCDTAGNPFAGDRSDTLGDYHAIAHDCPKCGGLASRGRTLAWLALECAAKGKARYPCLSCGAETAFPAELFLPEALEQIARHFQPNALLRTMTPQETLVEDWGEQLQQYNAGQTASSVETATAPEPADVLGEPGELLDVMEPLPSVAAPEDGWGEEGSGFGVQGSEREAEQGPGIGDEDISTREEPRADELVFSEEEFSGADNVVFEEAENAQGKPETSDVAESMGLVPQDTVAPGGTGGPGPSRAEAGPSPYAAAPARHAGASCPECGAAGAPRQSCCIQCVWCSVVFWIRQENIDRHGDTVFECPRCRRALVVPAGVWCASCEFNIRPWSVIEPLVLESSRKHADQGGIAAGGAFGGREARKTRRSWWRR